jgi:hypothetical protein
VELLQFVASTLVVQRVLSKLLGVPQSQLLLDWLDVGLSQLAFRRINLCRTWRPVDIRIGFHCCPLPLSLEETLDCSWVRTTALWQSPHASRDIVSLLLLDASHLGLLGVVLDQGFALALATSCSRYASATQGVEQAQRFVSRFRLP